MSKRPTSEGTCRLAELGVVTALGLTPAENWRRLLAGDTTGLSLRDDLIPSEERFFGAVADPLPAIPDSLSLYAGRNSQLALAAYEPLHEGVMSAISEFGAHRVGVVVASSTACVAEAEVAFRNRQDRLLANPQVNLDTPPSSKAEIGSDFQLIQLEYGGGAELIQELSGSEGPCYALSTACSAGAKSLAVARRLLDLGVCDAVIAGAADSLCKLTANGFHSLQALSKGVTNPMSMNRDGLILGEAAALFLVTRQAGGIQLLGTGESSDAHHISAPSPDGSGAYLAMRASLKESGLGVDEIEYLNLHGTGTLQNDAMESAAVSRLFGEGIPCSSTKPLVGHTLGAAGAVEAAFCWLILANRQGDELLLPPHVYDGQFDPALPSLSLVGVGERKAVSGRAAIMTNSFGFGGSNCTLVLGQGGA
ncbi:MAG TPA: beta-ketoacyl-ACP synthase [Myxococcales bacterium]|nr:beta-ketoacyl-ACP synthase [Myxococcales bacterium]